MGEHKSRKVINGGVWHSGWNGTWSWEYWRECDVLVGVEKMVGWEREEWREGEEKESRKV